MKAVVTVHRMEGEKSLENTMLDKEVVYTDTTN